VSNVVAGERTWAQIRLADGYQTEGVALEITFDPRYVRVEDSEPDAAGVQIRVDTLCDAPLNVGQEVIVNEVDNEAGVIRFESTWTLSGYLCADALVASIDVRGVTEGGCPLRFARADLANQDGESSAVERPGNALVLVVVSEGTPQPAEGPQPTSEAPAGASDGEAIYHTVQEGDTLFGIAVEYGTTVDAIVEANELEDPDAVSIGQRLLIPLGEAPAEAPPADSEEPGGDETEYTIQSGDTLLSIAQEFGTTVEELAELNELEPPYTITAGETLRIR
jgi:LysM repeat protein